MKACVISILLLMSSVAMFGQVIGFEYDADGNLESRYIVALRSAVQEEEESESVSVDFSDRKIAIYPNPTKGRISVEITPVDMEKENFLRLYDLSGKLIISQKIVSERTELEITGNPGIYLLDIHLGEAVSKWKIIKQ